MEIRNATVFWHPRNGELKLSKIAQGLGEKISLKKTTERLALYLGREGFWQVL